MAVVVLESTVITNRDASPKVISNSHMSKGDFQEAVGYLESTAADSVGSTYLMCSIPSNARVSQVLLSCDAMGATGAVDVGLYQSTLNGSAVVDADFFASAAVTTSALTNSDVTHESGVFGIEDSEKRVWEALGLSADPFVEYDVVLTATAVNADAASVVLKVRYVL